MKLESVVGGGGDERGASVAAVMRDGDGRRRRMAEIPNLIKTKFSTGYEVDRGKLKFQNEKESKAIVNWPSLVATKDPEEETGEQH
ncbi:hypothetical protein LguiA_027803 [Lonicera macranthoides]